MQAYGSWYSDTRKGFGNYRSSELEAVGRALRTYQSNTTPANLRALWTAITTHANLHPKEYRRRDLTGAMTALYNDVQQEISIDSSRVMGARTRQRPRPGPIAQQQRAPVRSAEPPMRDVAVASAGDRGGGLRKGQKVHCRIPQGHGAAKHYYFVIQDKQNNCGPTCIKMVIKHLWNIDVGVDAIEGSTANAENIGNHDWETQGTAAIPEGFANALKDAHGQREARIRVYGPGGGQTERWPTA